MCLWNTDPMLQKNVIVITSLFVTCQLSAPKL